MIYQVLLFTHITAGVASFILAPAYLLFASRANKSIRAVRFSAQASIITTLIFGFALILAGAPIGKSCTTLTVYSLVMFGLIKLGDVRRSKSLGLTK